MDDEEDDVLRKGLQRWPSPQIKPSEPAGRPPVPPNGMLPCRAHAGPRRFLYGNSGSLLLEPAGRAQPPDLQAMDRPDPRPALRVETLIGQKLQLIGDQFYLEHMMHHRNQRIQEPLWRRVAAALYTLLFGRDGRADRR